MPIRCDVCKLGLAFYKGSKFAKYVNYCPTCLGLDKENK